MAVPDETFLHVNNGLHMYKQLINANSSQFTISTYLHANTIMFPFSYSGIIFLFCIFVKNAMACISQTNHKPLIVTPLLESGHSEKARKLSKTNIGDLESYSGYFTVNKDCGSNLFFWFIPAEEDSLNSAVLLWLQGGPGSSSMFALFQENGPWTFTKKTELKRRDFPWTMKHHVIYLDQPPGTGFSFSDNKCIPNYLSEAVKLVINAIGQFFIMFPTLRNNKFFLTGESYAGHFLPAIAVEIDNLNNHEKKINLIGIIIGSPFLDYKCLNPVKISYELGIIDSQHLDQGNRYFDSFVKAIDQVNFTEAETQVELVYSVISEGALTSWYNIIYDREVENDFVQFLNDEATKRKLHVGSQNFTAFNNDVYNSLWPTDSFISIGPILEYLLNTNKYILGFYGGQLDLVCPYTSLTCTLEKLQWSGASQYLKATRKPWYVSGRLAGWVKVTGNLFEVAVKNAGHYVPRDQGEVALELISAAVADVPGSPLLTRLDYGSPDNTATASHNF